MPPILVLAVIVVAMWILAPASVGGPLVRAAAAGAAAFLVYRGWKDATGRERQVRLWIVFAQCVWLVAELGRLAGVLTGRPTLLPELGLIALGVAATGGFVTAARGRMRPADEAGLYLDALGIVAATIGGVIVVGASLDVGPSGVPLLAHGALFLAVMFAVLLLNVTTRVPLRLVGQWELLAGLGLGAAAQLGLLLPPTDGPARGGLHLTVAVAALLVGHGGSRWSAAVDSGGRYAAVAGWLARTPPAGQRRRDRRARDPADHESDAG